MSKSTQNELDALLNENQRLADRIAELEGELGTISAERDSLREQVETLKAAEGDFERAVASQVAALGISPRAASVCMKDGSNATLTEQSRAARG